MIKPDFKQEDCKDRKEYLVKLAIIFIRNHCGFIGMDDGIFFDEAECDGYCLADDIESEFGFEDEELKFKTIG